MTGFAPIERDEYVSLSGLELGRRVAAGELSPVRLVQLAIAIATEAEPEINAYVGFRETAALAEAAVLEAEAADGRLRGPLHGVPIAIKDNMYLAGEAALKGSRTTPTVPVATTSPMVERMVAAGMIVIGRTTTPEFGWKGTGISPLTGVTRNPWDPSRNSGGSSAGAGATVASGAVPIATGSDAGGSVRIPAAFCGVVGLKPTLSAIPLWPGTVNESLSHAGVLTRRVEDAAAVLEVTRGPDARDPQSAFAIGVADEPDRRLRVGVVREPFGIAPSPEVAARIAPALEGLAALGIADLVEIDLGDDLPRDVFEALWVTGRGLGFAELIAERGGEMDQGLVRLKGLAEAYDLAGFLGALQRRRAFNAAMFALLESVDLLIMPTMPIVAFEADREVPVGGDLDAPLPWITWTPYTYPFNVTGQPAITIPVDLGTGRLPVGLQIVGGWARDDTVLRFAAACETALAATNETLVAPR